MKYSALDLYDEIQPLSEIVCTSCRKTDKACEDSDLACIIFFSRGWRKTAANIYCPECAKKKLKLK